MKQRLLGLLAAMGMSAALLSFVVAPTAGAAGASPAGAADSSPDITITQTTKPSGWFCLPSFLALRPKVTNTPTSFVLEIKAVVRPCNTVTAHAVIYLMPANGGAWPQTLDQKQTFTINKRGTTTVTFAKHCQPAQFDVVTGATPPTIAPWGPWHGLPLFPFQFLTTSLQYFPGPDCIPGGECDDYTPSNVVADPSQVSPGDQVTISGNGVPGDTVTATLESSPALALGSSVVDSNGQFTIVGTVPASVTPGVYDVKLSSELCPTFSVISLIVGPQVQAANVAATLPPPTGDNGPMSQRVAAGLLALVAGGFAITRLSGRRARLHPSRSG